MRRRFECDAFLGRGGAAMGAAPSLLLLVARRVLKWTQPACVEEWCHCLSSLLIYGACALFCVAAPRRRVS